MTSENDLWPDEFTDSAGTTKLLVCPGPAGSAALVMTVGFRSVRLELPPAELPRLTRSLHKACGQPDPIVLHGELPAPVINGVFKDGYEVGRSNAPFEVVSLRLPAGPLDLRTDPALELARLIAHFALTPDPEPDPAVVALLEANGTGHDHAKRLVRAAPEPIGAAL